jgi:large subunit ribosomal protein L22
MAMATLCSYQIPEDKKDMFAVSRAEDVEASYRDLSQVCGRITNKSAKWAVEFLELAAEGAVPVLFKRHNKKLGHRRELGGRKGRYPMKSAKAVLKTLKSAIANATVKGLGEELIVVHAAANGKFVYPRLSPKGKRFRQNYGVSRIEIVVKEKVESTPESRKERKEKAKKKAAPKEEKHDHKHEGHVHADEKTGPKKEDTTPHTHEHHHEHKHEGEQKPVGKEIPKGHEAASKQPKGQGRTSTQ